ncbi:MAG: acyclic terpene utilization AtuA family protein [Lautropia sp.]
MNAVGRLLASAPEVLRVLSASGQLGYGIPRAALEAGIARRPHFIGCDMGSVDPGPAYLGSGEMATSAAVTRDDLTQVLTAARALDVPLIIGSAGTAGARPHLDATLAMVRDIAREHGLRFRLASIAADVAADAVVDALARGRLAPLGGDLAATADDIRACTHIVGQMGCEPFDRALSADPDVIVAGRACDTAIYAAIPRRMGFAMGHAMHMAKIVECTSICCVPGGRDAMLATLDSRGFELESMHPQRRATPMSVAAHSLYEQADPMRFSEPEGALDVGTARYLALDERRTRVEGATWEDASTTTIKLEGSMPIGWRTVLLAASADPRFIEEIRDILVAVEATTRAVVAGEYQLHPRLYGLDGVLGRAAPGSGAPREVFLLVEVISATQPLGMAVAKTFKQFLLHHGFPGRLCTGGNLAFPFTPPELVAGPAYRFALHHLMHTDDAQALFPVTIETV